MNPASESGYRGRLAPSPTGYLHLGHARTFWVAQERALAHQGVLVLRNDDLDVSRVRSEFVRSFIEDLRWLGCQWQEGPDVGGPLGPYSQHERLNYYQEAFNQLRESGSLYPCQCSRKDILASIAAPHANDDEPVYPGTCRSLTQTHGKLSWRFRVPDGERIEFHDALAGPVSFIAGVDFGDFVVWRHDGVPSYQLACVVDDARMKISEVVRGSDLLVSTARQLLLHRAMGWKAPKFCHCPLVRDAQGNRLAKRDESLSLRVLRQRGVSAEDVRNPGVDWMRWLDG